MLAQGENEREETKSIIEKVRNPPFAFRFRRPTTCSGVMSHL